MFTYLTGKRLRENRNVTFIYDEGLVKYIASRCTEVDSGARNADHILTNTLMPEMSREILSRMTTGKQCYVRNMCRLDH